MYNSELPVCEGIQERPGRTFCIFVLLVTFDIGVSRHILVALS